MTCQKFLCYRVTVGRRVAGDFFLLMNNQTLIQRDIGTFQCVSVSGQASSTYGKVVFVTGNDSNSFVTFGNQIFHCSLTFHLIINGNRWKVRMKLFTFSGHSTKHIGHIQFFQFFFAMIHLTTQKDNSFQAFFHGKLNCHIHCILVFRNRME